MQKKKKTYSTLEQNKKQTPKAFYSMKFFFPHYHKKKICWQKIVKKNRPCDYFDVVDYYIGGGRYIFNGVILILITPFVNHYI